MSQLFYGTGVALVTPFKTDKSIDFEALEKLVDSVIENGVNYLVALGTTAETPTLSINEKQQVLIAIIRRNAGKLPVVCGMGGNNTQEIIHLLNTFDLTGVAAILSVAPYYNKPTQKGLFEHFKAIAENTALPIILYNVPGRTSSNLLPETVCKLALECKNIIAIKEASGSIVQCMELIRTKPEHLTVLSGDDNLIVSQIAIGMKGIISVAANCLPAEMSQLVSFLLNNDYENATPIFYDMLPFIDLLFVEGNPSGVKCALSKFKILANELRLPLVPVSSITDESIEKFLKYNIGKMI